MCRHCVHDVVPARARFCAEEGSYLINYRHCHVCQIPHPIKNIQRSRTEDESEEDEYEEIITYQHTCSSCSHLIAEHYHSFRVAENVQDYLMECVLCGKGMDTQRLYTKETPDDTSSLTSSVIAAASVPLVGSIKAVRSSAPELQGRTILLDTAADSADPIAARECVADVPPTSAETDFLSSSVAVFASVQAMARVRIEEEKREFKGKQMVEDDEWTE